MVRPDLVGIRKRVEAASPGVWEYDGEYIAQGKRVINGFTSALWIAEIDHMNREDDNGEGSESAHADGAFIAHSHQDIPDLLAYVEHLEGALDASQSAMIGIAQELGLIDAQTPGGLPYGIKNPKVAIDLQISRNAKALAAHLAREPQEEVKTDEV